MSRAVVECDKITMQITRIWFSVTEAAECIGIGRTTMQNRCRYKSVTSGKYVYRFLDDWDMGERFTGSVNRPIAITNVKSKNVHWFHNFEEAADGMGYSTSTLSKALNHDKLIDETFQVLYLR